MSKNLKKSALGYEFKIENQGNNDPLTNQILKARGLDEGFLNPIAFDPSNYHNTNAMTCAIAIAKAIDSARPIIIVGDYDVDGTTSCAILIHAMEKEFCEPVVLIPNRFTEGYGLTDPMTQRVILNDAAIGGSSLVICVDNGTASVNQIAKLKAKGMSVIVIDHHEVSIEKSAKADILFNPHVTGPDELKNSCAAMLCMIVAFLLSDIRGTFNQKFYKKIGQLAGIATVADVMQLHNENRSLVKKAINSIRKEPIMAISNMIDLAKIERERFSSSDIAFQIAPRLNAPGRINTAEYTTRYLTCIDFDESETMCRQIDAYNEERKNYEKTAVEEAMEMIDRDKPGIISCYSPNWQKGVVGLVSSRITSMMGQPSLVGFLTSEGIITGSGRSIPGIDLGGAVREAMSEGLLLTGGGHAAACGFSCDQRNFKEAIRFIEQIAYDGDPSEQPAPEKIREFDLGITGDLLTVDQWKDLDRAEPFGQGFPQPSFAIKDGIKHFKEIKNDGVILTLSSGARATIFGAIAREIMPYINDHKDRKLTFGGRLSLSKWRGEEKLDFFVDDAAAGENP